jgi:hypothetical protein
MVTQEETRLLQLLDERHSWPCLYSFKFIVPAAKGAELQSLIPEAEQVETRSSSGGRYTAFTFHCPMGSGREVLGIYARVRGINGIVSL